MLTPEHRRGLTPLFWSHVLPYGEVKLDMASQLTLGTGLPITEMAQLGPTGYRSPRGAGGVPGAPR